MEHNGEEKVTIVTTKRTRKEEKDQFFDIYIYVNNDSNRPNNNSTYMYVCMRGNLNLNLRNKGGYSNEYDIRGTAGKGNPGLGFAGEAKVG